MKRAEVSFFLMIILASISMSCVDRKYYIVSYQIINEDTYDVISEGSLHVGERKYETLSDLEIKNFVSTQLGFKLGFETTRLYSGGGTATTPTWTKTVDEINQRLLFIEIKKYIEYKKFLE
jgi:hypothetical protein